MKPRKTGRNLKTFRFLSKSPEETRRFGAKLARSLRIPGVILLRGALGTGKTTLTCGIAQGLGIDDPSLVNSPSFTLVNIYHGICPIYHVDLYRLEGQRDLYSIGLDDFLGKEGLTVIEWSEKLRSPLEQATEIELEDAGDDLRLLRVTELVFRKRRALKPGAGNRKNK
jgi:tRNA threonylcarbamoyladenosine biosynthesis protein TsaE